MTLLAATAILGWQRRQLLLLTAFATAIFGELPVAAILIVGALPTGTSAVAPL